MLTFRTLLCRPLTLAALACAFLLPLQVNAQAAAKPKIRMYLFDNGQINGLDASLFNFKKEEVKSTDFVVVSELIVHPTKGILLWESGSVPDDKLPKDGSPYKEGVTTVTKSLSSQLAAIGYSYKDIKYFAMSHLHSDHSGNANSLVHAKWIVQKADRDMMFAGKEVRVMDATLFSELKNADTILLNNEDYDVFGDGSVKIISAPGHTPGHQVLLVNLVNTGPVLLAGDLYHLPEELTTGRTPTFEYDPPTSAKARAKIQQIVKQTGARMWIGHDKATHAALNFAPKFYE